MWCPFAQSSSQAADLDLTNLTVVAFPKSNKWAMSRFSFWQFMSVNDIWGKGNTAQDIFKTTMLLIVIAFRYIGATGRSIGAFCKDVVNSDYLFQSLDLMSLSPAQSPFSDCFPGTKLYVAKSTHAAALPASLIAPTICTAFQLRDVSQRMVAELQAGCNFVFRVEGWRMIPSLCLCEGEESLFFCRLVFSFYLQTQLLGQCCARQHGVRNVNTGSKQRH